VGHPYGELNQHGLVEDHGMKIMDVQKPFDIRDLREKDKFVVDDKFLNGYAKFVGIYAVGVYTSLSRHANKEQKSWPSIGKLCEELNVGKTSVIEAIKRLEFWDVIKKERLGKMATNRYYLVDKKQWKSLNEYHLKEFSEVCHTDFSGLRDRLQKSATRTSIVRKPSSKEIQEKGGRTFKKSQRERKRIISTITQVRQNLQDKGILTS